MDTADTLLTIAEVSVAFAGFATLASIIGKRSSRDDRRVDAMRLRNVVSTSLVIIALAFIPVFLLDFVWPEDVVWTISSLIAATWLISAVIPARRRSRQVQEYSGYNRYSYRFGILAAVLAISGFLFNATGIPGGHSDKVYLGALLLGLTVTGIQFSQVVSSLLEREQDE